MFTDLRDVGAILRKRLVVIVSRAWVEMRSWIQVLAHVCSDPISDILLVHGVLICLVGARSGHVFCWRLVVGLDAVVELGLLKVSCFVLILRQRVSEVEVAQDSVFVGGGRDHRFYVVATAGAEVGRLPVLLGTHGRVSLRTKSIPVFALALFLFTQLLLGLVCADRLADLKGRNSPGASLGLIVATCLNISAGPGNTLIRLLAVVFAMFIIVYSLSEVLVTIFAFFGRQAH